MHFHKLKETKKRKDTQDSQSMQMTVGLNSALALSTLASESLEQIKHSPSQLTHWLHLPQLPRLVHRLTLSGSLHNIGA